MRISVFESEELQATVLALRGFDRALQAQVRAQTKRIGQPEWQSELRSRASTRLESRVLADTGRVKVSNQNVTLTSASVGRALSGGGRPAELWGAVEFGTAPRKVRVRGTSTRGKPYSYTRTVGTGFRPRRPAGYVVHPAAKAMIPRFASLWVQTTVRTFHEALEGR